VSAADHLPVERSLDALREAAAACRGCHLHEDATQTVFGDGAEDARLILVGEQPGDEEDREGEPFVGPAGRELDRGLERAGIPRDEVYITNVVKHFKFEPRGRRRLHQTPDDEEISACLPWLHAELEAVTPDLVVCLGATAAKALIHPDVRVTKDRGRIYAGPDEVQLTPTVHPSSILRTPDDYREAAREAFHEDLARIAAWLAEGFEEVQVAEVPREQLGLFEREPE
jgi:uracil-DNA glycosylase